MLNAPCKNPNCKSYGRPHPNCRCYAEMADGGKAKAYCETGNAHEKECEYYADGGQAGTDQEIDVGTGTEAPPSPPPVDSNATTDRSVGSSVEAGPLMFDQLQGEDITPPAPSFDELQDDNEKELSSFDELKDDRYNTSEQKMVTALEGAAQGFAGPIATLAEKGLSKLGVPGLSDEEITGRQENNPVIHGAAQVAGTAAGLMTGVGEAGLVTKAAEKILPKSLPYLGKIGSEMLKAFSSNAAMAAGDEVTKAMLGQGDPDHAVASVLANVGISGLMGSLFRGGSAALAATDAKLGSKAASFLGGFGAKSSGDELAPTAAGLRLLEKDLFDEKAFNLGFNSYKKAIDTSAHVLASPVSIGTTKALESAIGPSGYIAFPFIQQFVMDKAKVPINAAGKLIAPTVTKWLSEGAPSRLLPLIDYATKVDQGNRLLNRSIDGLFKGGIQQISPGIGGGVLKNIDDWVYNGGINSDIQDEIYSSKEPEGYAEGGEVDKGNSSKLIHDHPIAAVYPEQNVMLQTAKGRISNYLQGLRPPQNVPTLPFDEQPDQREKRRSYDRALNIAAKPLSILEKVNNGTIEPSHVVDFVSMYPELYGSIKQKITSQIVKAQMDGKKPSFKIRQGLSLLMGTPLSGEMLPQNIQAAQAVFQNQNAQQQGNAPKPTKSKGSLSKSDQSFLTSNQSLVSRQQKQ